MTKDAAKDGDIDRVWALMERIGFCMLGTRDGEDIRSRPMAAHVDREANAIHFLTDAEGHKDDEIERDTNVNLAFADSSGQKYVSVTGNARVSHDTAKVRDLWSIAAKAWWDSPDDPSIRVLTVTPKDAQYWDSPGRIMTQVSMLLAAVTSSRPAVGDNAKVRM